MPELIRHHKAKYFPALVSNSNSFIYLQQNSFKYCFLVLIFPVKIIHLFAHS